MKSRNYRLFVPIIVLFLAGCAELNRSVGNNSGHSSTDLVRQFTQQNRAFSCQTEPCLLKAERLSVKPKRAGALSTILIESGLQIGLFETVDRYVYAGDMAIFLFSSGVQIALHPLNYDDFVPAVYSGRPQISKFFRCGFDGESELADQYVCNASLQFKSTFGLENLKHYENENYLLYSGYDPVQEKVFSFIVPKEAGRSMAYIYEAKGVSQDDAVSMLQW